MDWDKAKVIHRESNRFQRWIREAVEIRKRAPKTMNRDDGAYTLAHTWDVVLTKRPPPHVHRTEEGALLPHSEGERHPSRGMTRPPPFHQTAEGPAPHPRTTMGGTPTPLGPPRGTRSSHQEDDIIYHLTVTIPTRKNSWNQLLMKKAAAFETC